MKFFKCPNCGSFRNINSLKSKYKCKKCDANIESNFLIVSISGLLVGSVLSSVISAQVESSILDVFQSVIIPLVIALIALQLFHKSEVKRK